MKEESPISDSSQVGVLGPSDERNEYGIYLGVFFVLAALLLVLWFIETTSFFDPSPPADASSSGTDTSSAIPEFLRTTVFALSLTTMIICGVFAPDRYFLAERPKDQTEKIIPLRRKKAVLVVAFCTYLVALTVLTMWAGAAVSSYSSLLVLTGALSVYVANTPRMQLFIAFTAVSAYALTACYYCSTKIVAPAWHPSRPATINIGVTLAIVLLSYMATRLQRKPRSEDTT